MACMEILRKWILFREILEVFIWSIIESEINVVLIYET